MKTSINKNISWILLLTTVYFNHVSPGFSQQKNQRNDLMMHTAVIEFMHGQPNAKGLLYAVQDSAVILLSGRYPSNGSDLDHHKFTAIPANQIYKIKLRPAGKVKRSAKKGVIYGTAAGLLLGGLEAAAYESDPWLEADTGQLLLAGALSGAMTGAIYGAIIGSFKTKIPINGSQKRFDYQKDFLSSRAYQLTIDDHHSQPIHH